MSDRFTVNGYTVRIVQDDDAEHANPRDSDTNLGIMLANGHRNYTLGDEKFATDEYTVAAAMLKELAENGDVANFPAWATATFGSTVVLPLWLLDHSGLSMSTGSPIADPGNWDSGIVGFIFDTAKTREVTGCTPDMIEQALTDEVATYSQYLEGDVWGYTITSPNGDEVDACWGFLGREYAEQEARSSAEAQSTITYVYLSGDFVTGVSVVGPYTDREDADADAAGSPVVALSEPPTRHYQLVVPDLGDPKYHEHWPIGKVVTFNVSRADYRKKLSEGWTEAPKQS